MHFIFAIAVIISSCIDIVKCLPCETEIMCYGFDAAGNTGHLSLDGQIVATWTSSSSAARKKRQATNHADGWHLFSLTSGCEIADRLHITEPTSTGNEYLGNFSDFMQAQPQGAWILGCSAGGVDPAQGDTELETETLNLFRATGIDTNSTNSIEGYTSGSLLSSDAALIFSIQKGFPENADWRIIDTANAPSSGDDYNILRRTLDIGWDCGIPPMAGAELYTEFDDSDASYHAHDTYIVSNTPVVGNGCRIRGWEYIPNADNSDGSQAVNFGFVSESGGTHSVRGQQSVTMHGSSNHRQFVCASDDYPVQEGDMYGVWYDTPGAGRSMIRKVYDQPTGHYPYPCGREPTWLDTDTVTHSASSTFPISNTNTDTEQQSLAFRPIFDPNFVLSCTCAVDADCNANDDKMFCGPGSQCACMNDYAYNRAQNICIKDGDLAQTDGSTVTPSLADTGEGADLIDTNRDGSLYSGTCASIAQGAGQQRGPWVVIDLNMVADVYAVQITTPSPASGFVTFNFGSTQLKIAGAEANLAGAFPAGITSADITSIELTGSLPWQFYTGMTFSGDVHVLTSAGTYSAADLGTVGFNIASLRIAAAVGKLRVSSGVNTAGTSLTGLCLDVSPDSSMYFSNTCTRSFILQDNQLIDLQTQMIVGDSSGNLFLGGAAISLATEDTNSDGSTDLSILDLTDGAQIEVDGGSSCFAADNSNNAIISTTCLTFTFEDDFATMVQAWEASQYSIEGSSCGDDVAILENSFPVRPCVEILETEAGFNPDVFYADMDQVAFTDRDTSFSRYCRNRASDVFFQASETGLHDFRVGVSRSFDSSAEIDETTFPTCASYVGNLPTDQPMLVNCSSINSGQYVAIYIPHDANVDDQMLLCDIQVFGRPALTCEENNGGCNHNCVPGQRVGETLCTCFSDEYVLQPDGRTCVNVNECLDDTLHVCDEDSTATCVDEDPGYTCQCAPSFGDVVQFDVTAERCIVPQEFRNTSTGNNVCSYSNGGCSDVCIPGASVYDYTCQCDQTTEDRQLSSDGLTCELVDACTSANDCENDPNILAQCQDADLGYTCECNTEGVYWDPDLLKCTTGRVPDLLCNVNTGNTDNQCAQICRAKNPRTINLSPILDFECACNDGYRLSDDERSCDNIDECSEDAQICAGGDLDGTCSDTPGSYTCDCSTGYESATSGGCTDINECDVNDGGCQQQCDNSIGSFQCSCFDGYELGAGGLLCRNIDECADDNLNRCDTTRGSCTDTEGSYTCSCPDGFRYNDATELCEDILECETNGQACNHSCEDTLGGFVCTCNPGYELFGTFTCENIDECARGVDMCDRQCTDYDGGYNCSCPEAGRYLADDERTCINIDECDTDNGGCSHICEDTEGSFLCQCPPGWFLTEDLRTCTQNDVCANNDCDHGCVPRTINTNTVAQCTCDQGWQLASDDRSCLDVNECTQGTSMCSQSCENTPGSFYCDCNAGFTLRNDLQSCTDINECARKTDGCQQRCRNLPGTYFCLCLPNYEVDPQDPTRCLSSSIEMSMIIDVDFDEMVSFYTFNILLNRVCDEVRSRILGISQEDITFLVTCTIRRGSLIVDFSITNQNTTTIDDPNAAYIPYLASESLESFTILDQNNNTIAPQRILVNAVNQSTGEQVMVEVTSAEDACVLWQSIMYCQNGSTCELDDDQRPFCNCPDGQTGRQCDVTLIIVDPPGGVDDDALTGTDVILISVFATLLVVLVSVIIFYALYRSQRPVYVPSEYYSRSKYSGETYRSSREPLYTQRWWRNLPTVAAPVPGADRTLRPEPRPAPRPRAQPQDMQWSQYIMGDREERLSRWPAYRAYGIASRFTGSTAPGSRYSWATRAGQRY